MLICITGLPDLGKSTMANKLKNYIISKNINCSVLSTDSYALSRSERSKKKISCFHEESHDLEKLSNDILKLRNNRGIIVPINDHKVGGHKNSMVIHSCNILIVEGIFSYHPAIYLDIDALKISLDCNLDTYRNIKRNYGLHKRGENYICSQQKTMNDFIEYKQLKHLYSNSDLLYNIII